MDGRKFWSFVAGDTVVDLGKALPKDPALMDFIASPDLEKRGAIVAAHKPNVTLADIVYLPGIERPEKIICAVRNFLDHHKEAVAHGMNVNRPFNFVTRCAAPGTRP